MAGLRETVGKEVGMGLASQHHAHLHASAIGHEMRYFACDELLGFHILRSLLQECCSEASPVRTAPSGGECGGANLPQTSLASF